MSCEPLTAGPARRRRAGCGLVGAAGAATALASVFGAPTARADETDALSNILGQADATMTKAADALLGISIDALSANAASALFGEVAFDFAARSAILAEESLQAGLSSSAQDSSQLILLDKGLVVDTTQVLAADQTAAADPVSVFEQGVNAGMLLDDAQLAFAIVNLSASGIEVKLLDLLGLSDILQL